MAAFWKKRQSKIVNIFDDEIDDVLPAPMKKQKKVSDRAEIDRLINAGTQLAESERFREALEQWDRALLIDGRQPKLFEMQAQLHMELNDHFSAIRCAKKAVDLNPLWTEAHQTLARAHLNLGDASLALKFFSRSVYLDPSQSGIWDELRSVKKLLDEKKVLIRNQAEQPQSSAFQVTEVDPGQSKAVVVSTKVTSSTSPTKRKANIDRLKPIKTPKGFVKMRDTIK